MAFGTGTEHAVRPHGTIVAALNRDWDEQVDRHRGPVHRWSRRHGALTGCASLAEVLLAVRGQPDAALGALLTEVSNGDQLAARAVLQALLGRMVQMAGRDRSAGIGDYVSTLWCQIHAYPLAARPERVAANLALDTLKSVVRERRWLRGGEVSPWPPELFCEERLGWPMAADDEQVFSAREVLRAGVERGLIDAATQEVLVSVYVDELNGSEAADRHWSSAASVRTRCSRAVRRLAAHRDELLAAVA